MKAEVSEKESLQAQILLEKNEIARIEEEISRLRISSQKNVQELKQHLSDQHSILGDIISYAKRLEEQLNELKSNVDNLKQLHKENLH